MATAPDRMWERIRIHQVTWGYHKHCEGSTEPKTYIRTALGGRNRCNVASHRVDGSELHNSNFTRALSGLVKRGLAQRYKRPGGATRWQLTASGIEAARKLPPHTPPEPNRERVKFPSINEVFVKLLRDAGAPDAEAEVAAIEANLKAQVEAESAERKAVRKAALKAARDLSGRQR